MESKSYLRDRKCARCHETLPPSSFYINQKTYRFDRYCKECRREYNLEYRARQKARRANDAANDERREAAARLRKREPKSCLRGALGWRFACGHYDCCEDCSRHAAMLLADLIEPEERTCEYIGDEISGGCSVCRGWLDPACAYCPSCGAKVVE